jgi:hypothetical protein
MVKYENDWGALRSPPLHERLEFPYDIVEESTIKNTHPIKSVYSEMGFSGVSSSGVSEFSITV